MGDVNEMYLALDATAVSFSFRPFLSSFSLSLGVFVSHAQTIPTLQIDFGCRINRFVAFDYIASQFHFQNKNVNQTKNDKRKKKKME